MFEDFDIPGYLGGFAQLNGTLAGLAFAALAFQLSGNSRATTLAPEDRREREQGLAVLVVCVLAHLIVALVALFGILNANDTIGWIVATAMQVPFTIGTAYLFVTVYLLLRANSAELPSSVAAWVLDITLLSLAFNAFGWGIASVSVLGYQLSRPADLPAEIILLVVISTAAPIILFGLCRNSARVRSFVSSPRSLEMMLRVSVVAMIVSAFSCTSTALFQLQSVDRTIWVFLVCATIFFTVTLLAITRLWLQGLSGTSSVTPL